MARSVYVVTDIDEVCIGTVEEVQRGNQEAKISAFDLIQDAIDEMEYGDNDDGKATFTIEIR